MDRWVEHCSESYSKASNIFNDDHEAMNNLPCMLELDELPSATKPSKAIDSLPTGKALGLDGIPTEATKCAKEALLSHQHDLLYQC